MKDRIKEVRLASGLNQAAFGDKVGVTGAAISRIESGDRAPSEQVLRLICSEFGISRHWLETGEGEMSAPAADDDIRILARAMEGQCEAKKTILRAVASMPDDLLNEVVKYLREAQKDPQA